MPKLIHAFIFSSQIEVLTGLRKKSIRLLQLIQDTTAESLLTLTRWNMTLHSLNHRPDFLCQRIAFTVLIVYKAVDGLKPKCISDFPVRYKASRTLRSSKC